MTKKIYAVILCFALVAGVIYAASFQGDSDDASLTIGTKKENIVIWYTDDAIGDYLAKEAVAYYEATGVRVTVEQVTGLQYLEQIQEAVLEEDTSAPDLYVVTNDILEKAALSNLAATITDPEALVSSNYFSEAALSAVRYQGDYVGYPLYFETSIFLYNASYLETVAETTLEDEINTAMAEEAQAAADGATSTEELEAIGEDTEDATEAISEEDVVAKAAEILPATISDIMTFADSYDAPENVESIFEWDVTDIFYTYFIVGGAMDVGGEDGDDATIMDIYNEDAVTALTLYQSLNQFFSIDTTEVEYEDVLQEFVEGKILFTIATTDAIATLESATKSGEFTGTYQVAEIPDVDDTIASRSLSVTNCIAINGFSEKQALANDFASFILESQTQDFYTITGKIGAKTDVEYDNEAIYAALTEYATSIPMPKLMKTAGFWARLEVAFSEIWNGEDVDSILSELDETVKRQVAE